MRGIVRSLQTQTGIERRTSAHLVDPFFLGLNLRALWHLKGSVIILVASTELYSIRDGRLVRLCGLFSRASTVNIYSLMDPAMQRSPEHRKMISTVIDLDVVFPP